MSDASPNPCFISLADDPKVGGPYKTVNQFQRALGGHIVAFSRIHKTGQTAESGRLRYVQTRSTYYIPDKPQKDALALVGYARLLSCHSIFRYHNKVTLDLSRRLDVPFWAVPHGSMDPWVFRSQRLIKEGWFKLFGRGYLRDATHIICATERERDKVGERYDGDNLRVVHWPVESLETSGQAEARQALRQRLNMPMGARVLLYFGRYHSMKRPDDTIRLFRDAGLSERTHLVMAGIDSDTTRATLAARAGDHPRIHVLPAVYGAERLEMLLAADAYISLSYRENFNHTAAEAMSAGQAVILSPGNDLQHSFPPDEAFGWRLRTESDEEAIEALRALDHAGDPEIRAMGAAAQDWTRRKLSFETFRTRLRELYAEATGGAPSPEPVSSE